MTINIAIQGEPGSACEMAVSSLWLDVSDRLDLVYSPTAREVVDKLRGAVANFAVFALESPTGTYVAETVQALADLPYRVIASCCLPVNHVVLTRVPIHHSRVTKILSHSIPLAKHADFLHQRYLNALLEPVDDTGTAARQLAEGRYGETAAVIALPITAKIFGLNIECHDLPGNKGYLTKFILIETRI